MLRATQYKYGLGFRPFNISRPYQRPLDTDRSPQADDAENALDTPDEHTLEDRLECTRQLCGIASQLKSGE